MSDRALAHYAEILRNDFAAFVERCFPEIKPSDPFEFNWHIEVLAEKLENVRLGKTRRLIINLPPRYLKSVIGSVAFPAFVLGHKPSTEILCVSYGQELADEFSRSCLNLMRQPFYQALFKTRLDPDRQATEEFKTTKKGCRRATSYTGGITGRGADLIIIDDPIKAYDSQSNARRTSVNEDFYQTIYSRLNNKMTGAIVIIMQRLHADDLVAYVQERGSWEVVAFPAVAEHDETYDVRTPYGPRRIVRKEGEPLHPAREDLVSLRQTRSQDEYAFAAQYQQDPQPPGGLIVKRHWLHRYDFHNPPKFEAVIQSWDTGSKATEISDYSVCTTWGLKDKRLYLLHVLRDKLEFPEMTKTVREHADKFGVTTVLVEDHASGIQLVQELRRKNFSRIQPIQTRGEDKVMRLRLQTGKIEGGFVFFPEKSPAQWFDTYIMEILSFPYVKNDDQVDSTTQVLAWLSDTEDSSFEKAMEWTRLMGTERPDGQVELVKVRSKVAGTWISRDGVSYSRSENQILLVDEDTADQMAASGTFEKVPQ